MRMLRMLVARVRGLLRRNTIAAEIRDEMRFHVDMRTEELSRRGLQARDARRNRGTTIWQSCRHADRGYDVRGGGVMDTVRQDSPLGSACC